MTKNEKMTLILSVVALAFSVVSSCYVFYFENFRKNRALSVIPVSLKVTYDKDEWRYKTSLAFVNNGNVDIVLSDVGLLMLVPKMDSSGVEVGSSDMLAIEPVILKPGDSVTINKEAQVDWSNNEIPFQNIDRARFQYFYSGITVDGIKTSRLVGIDTIYNNEEFEMRSLSSPLLEGFDKAMPKPPSSVSFGELK